MAFTRTPDISTYKTVPLMFDGTSVYRSGNLQVQRDINIINMFYDRVSQENKTREVYLKKRPGLRATAYSLTKDSASDNLRGYYYDAGSNAFYWAVNDNIYRVAPDSGSSVRTVTTLTTSSGYVGFCEYLKSDNTRYVVFSDGVELWLDDYAATTATKVTSVDMPTPHVPCPIYLDGYIFLADANSGDLWNSNVDDPFTWTAGDYITAEMSADYIVKLTQNRNYIVAFGTNSMEVFWDAANESGSPLNRNDSGYKEIGYVTGLCQIGGLTFFVGQDRNKLLGVYVLDGFKLTKVSNEIVERTLQPIDISDNIKAQVIADRDGYVLSSDGHTFYCLVIGQTTWVYDLEEKMWYEWKNSSGTGLNIQAAWGMYRGAQYVAVGGQTTISMFSPYVYQDFDVNFTCQYTTEKFNAGSQNKKTLNRLTVLADMFQTSGTSNLTVTWSDNDWATVAGTKNINLFDPSPRTHQLGQFRTRSFRVTYADVYPLRLRGLELDLNIGTN